MMDPAADLAAQLNNLGSREAYLRAAGELLFRLFPSEGTGWNSLDGATGTAEIVAHPDMPLDGLAQKLADAADDNPYFHCYVQDAGAGMWRPRRLSDLVSDRALHRTRTYSEGLRPLGIDRQISLLAGRPGPLSVRAWTVNRLHQDFTDDEVALARHVQPMLRLLELAYSGTRKDFECRAEVFMLTPREEDVLHLVGNGLTATAIGHFLGISPRTVTKHLENAYAKLGCTNRIDALRILRGP